MYEDIKEKLQKNLSKRRYEHSLRVADTAERLALKNGVDTKKAYLAGLLHDCARDMEDKKLLRYVADKKISAHEHELRYPVLLHTRVGGDIAKKEYGIKDEAVLDAIMRHTAGGSNMSELGKVLFVADFIEPGRKDPEINLVSKLAETDLNKAVYEKAAYMLEFSKRVREKVHPDVLATVEFYKHY